MQELKKNILILDDDADIRELLSTILELKGYNVISASDIEVFHFSEVPDIILLDVLLSGKSGIKICSELKSNSKTQDIPVIMFSGLSDAKEQCLAAGADEFIVKPLKIHTLLTLINKLLIRSEILF